MYSLRCNTTITYCNVPVNLTEFYSFLIIPVNLMHRLSQDIAFLDDFPSHFFTAFCFRPSSMRKLLLKQKGRTLTLWQLSTRPIMHRWKPRGQQMRHIKRYVMVICTNEYLENILVHMFTCHLWMQICTCKCSHFTAHYRYASCNDHCFFLFFNVPLFLLS